MRGARMIITLLAVAAASLLTAALSAEADCAGTADSVVCVSESCGDDTSRPLALTELRQICCAATASTGIAPARPAPASLRTQPGHTRAESSHSQSGFKSRAIDSSTAGVRYGLYNHKILFASRAADHYLIRVRRLVI